MHSFEIWGRGYVWCLYTKCELDDDDDTTYINKCVIRRNLFYTCDTYKYTVLFILQKYYYSPLRV